MKKIMKVVLLSVASVMAMPAFSSGGAPEPGAGCEAVSGDAFGRVQGAPYSGTVDLYWDGTNALYDGTVTQFGNSALTMTFPESVIPGVNSLEDFQSITTQDMRGFCLQNVQGGPSDFAEVQAARQLNFVGASNESATVEVIVVPLLQ